MIISITHIDISPNKTQKCCQNCKSFSKFGVHLGFCSNKNKEMLDNQKCKKFEFKTINKQEL